MALKINEGNSFLHPVTGRMIGPGQFYEDYVIETPIKEEEETEIVNTIEEDSNKKNEEDFHEEKKENNELEDENSEVESKIGGEADGQGEVNSQNTQGNRRQRRATDNK